MKELAIAIRVSPFLSKWCIPYFKSKFELVTTCMLSLKDAINKIDAKIYVILDRCPQEYKKLFFKIFNEITFYETNIKDKKRSWFADVLTFKFQNNILKNEQAEIFLFQEDDYFYFKEIGIILDFMKIYNIDFVSPYCHPWVIKGWEKFIDKVILFHNYLFFNAPFTSMTFFITKRAFNEIINVNVDLYSREGDIRRWLILTKNIKPLRFDLPYWRYRIALLKYFSLYLKLRKYQLFMPYPTFATHVPDYFTESNRKIIENYKKQAQKLIDNLV